MSILPRGHQWRRHQGLRETERRRRRMETRRAAETKAAYGVEVDAEGRTPAGLIVPGVADRRRTPSIGGR